VGHIKEPISNYLWVDSTIQVLGDEFVSTQGEKREYLLRVLEDVPFSELSMVPFCENLFINMKWMMSKGG